MKPRVVITPEKKAAIYTAFMGGKSIVALAKQYGCVDETIRRIVDPEWAALRQSRINDARRQRQGQTVRHYTPTHHVVRSVSPEDEQARFAELPRVDRRSLTGQLFGDPLPERSALSRRA
jgi:transposase-like protein